MFIKDCNVQYYKVKQTKKDLKKYFHPFSLNYLTVYVCAHVQCLEPKICQEKVPTSKKTTVLWPSIRYYSMFEIKERPTYLHKVNAFNYVYCTMVIS